MHFARKKFIFFLTVFFRRQQKNFQRLNDREKFLQQEEEKGRF